MAMKTYYMLTKPGIIMGNIITTGGGFALAAKGAFNPWMFLMTLVGLAFIVASAGVFNSYIDQAIDAKMSRTKDRPLVKGEISTKRALLFGFALGLVGVIVLAANTNILTVLVAIAGFFIYLVLYAFLKYRSFYGTLVGSVAGAVPPLVGYCAVSDTLDVGAWILFSIVVLWQMPHFFAIAIYHLEDYTAASIPVLPIEKGMYVTKVQMTLYIIAFIATAIMLTLTGYTGYWFAAVAAFLGTSWLALCLYGFYQNASQDKKWAHQMFVYSLVVIMGLFIAIPFDTINQ